MGKSLFLIGLVLLVFSCKQRFGTSEFQAGEKVTTNLDGFKQQYLICPKKSDCSGTKEDLTTKKWEGDPATGGKDEPLIRNLRKIPNNTRPVMSAKAFEIINKSPNKMSDALFYTRVGVPKDPTGLNRWKPDPDRWIGDHLFTKAVTPDGEHVRTEPYVRIVSYGEASSGKQKSADELKKIVRPGDILVFWHPEMNDFAEMGEAGIKEAAKLRSTHAGMAWYDGEKIWALNSPHNYHQGWLDITHKYPFHIFRLAPNAKNKAIQNAGGFNARYKNKFKDPKFMDALGEYMSIYAAQMGVSFSFPGDYNGGDPLNLFDVKLIKPYHDIVQGTRSGARLLPDLKSITMSGGSYKVPNGSRGKVAQLYCAEYVWTSMSMALNMLGSHNQTWKPGQVFQASFNKKQYTDGTPPDFVSKRDRLNALKKSHFNAGGWTKNPAFLFEPYTFWDVVEAFIFTYYGDERFPRPARGIILAGMKATILKNLGTSSNDPIVKNAQGRPDPEKTMGLYVKTMLGAGALAKSVDDPKKYVATIQALGDKQKVLNHLYNSIVAIMMHHTDNAQTERRKAILKQVAEKLMTTDAGSGAKVPMRFLPPHAFILEAQKLDSNIMYVASAFPRDVLKKVAAKPVNVVAAAKRETPRGGGVNPRVPGGNINAPESPAERARRIAANNAHRELGERRNFYRVARAECVKQRKKVNMAGKAFGNKHWVCRYASSRTLGSKMPPSVYECSYAENRPPRTAAQRTRWSKVVKDCKAKINRGDYKKYFRDKFRVQL